MRETVNNKVYFDQADYDKLLAEVPKVWVLIGVNHADEAHHCLHDCGSSEDQRFLCPCWNS